MQKHDDESKSEGQQNITLQTTQHDSNKLLAFFNSLEDKHKNHTIELYNDGNVDDGGGGSGEACQQKSQRPKKRHVQRLKVKKDNKFNSSTPVPISKENMSSEPCATSLTYSTSSSSSSQSSGFLSYNIQPFVDNSSKRYKKKISLTNNNCNSQHNTQQNYQRNANNKINKETNMFKYEQKASHLEETQNPKQHYVQHIQQVKCHGKNKISNKDQQNQAIFQQLVPNNSFNKQVTKEPISEQPTTVTKTIIISNNIKCHIFNNSANTQTTAITEKIAKEKIHRFKEDFHEHNNSKRIGNTRNSDRIEDQEPVNGTGKTIEGFPIRCERELLDSSENHHKRHNSIRQNSTKKSVVGSKSKHHSIVSFPTKHSKQRPHSPTQNPESKPTAESKKKRFSYCSSCSSSNSCNCDITGENSNTLYEGFGVGVVVSSSYTDEYATDCSGAAVSFTSADCCQGPLAVRGPNGEYNSLESPQRHEVQYSEEFDDREDHDRTANASENCSDFDEIGSEPPLTEELARVETDNKILSNNLKNYSKFYEKLYKKPKRLSQFPNHCEPIDGDLASQSQISYQIQDITQKDLIDSNILLCFSNKGEYLNTMNFDAGDKNESQLASPARGAAEGGRGLAGEEDGDKNELNIYATGGMGDIQNIPETMNGTTICGVTPGAGPNQQKSTGGAAQKRTQRRGGKQQPDRPERALFCLTLKNPVRAFCIRIVDSKHPFKNNKKQLKTSLTLFRTLNVYT